jgi:type I restriction enzyme S subunit
MPWMGEVPEHWEVKRLRNAAEMRVSNVDKLTKDGEEPVRLCNYVDVYKNDRIRSRMAFMRATATTDEIQRFRLQAGDVLITKDSEAWNDIGVPALVMDTDVDIVSGYHLALLRPFPKRVDGGYLFRALQSTAVAYQFHVEANGVTRYGLSHSAIKSVWVPLPPLSEQAAIVRFLDHVDRRIQRYTRAKQKLIKLLEEQKQAIIHRAVTRGLDPDVRLKPSGVDWLGDVPEHWEVKPIGGFCTYISYGFTNPMPGADNGPYMLTANDIGDGEIRYEIARHTTQHAFDHLLTRKSRPVRGDVLVTKDGTLGRVAVFDGQAACINQSVALLRTDSDQVLPDYFALTLRAPLYQERMALEAGGTAIKHIYITRLAKMKVTFPGVDEQGAILGLVGTPISRLERGRAAAYREISLLREYRTRLIADVVTGKLDVREAAARLPDEAEETEALDEADDLTGAEDDAADDLDTFLEEVEA